MYEKKHIVNGNDTRKAAYAVVLAAMGVALSPYTSFPVGIAKINPTQHFINIIGGVLLGPWWAMTIAAVIGIIRNVMGIGTLLAFPGGMIGAFLAGYMYRITRNMYWAGGGEIIGTGLIAPVISGVLVAPVFMEKAIPVIALIPSFMGSTIAGTILGIMAVRLLERADMVALKAS